MHVNPQEMRSLRDALRVAIHQLDAQFDPRSDAEKQSLPPAIGGEWLGGIYVGPTLDNNERAHLVLLPEEFEGNWQNAATWADERKGVLPARIDLLVLWLNARDHFKAEWYWSSEEVAGYPEYAWCQNFSYGYQNYYHKITKLRARAVRRVPIE
jgi:hypothetical protein